uniref:Putative secreted protein n=1 Tax=Anopheles triannulatus TaxID=58253 RepID=A0A2M4B2Z4_9DIPT
MIGKVFFSRELLPAVCALVGCFACVQSVRGRYKEKQRESIKDILGFSLFSNERKQSSLARHITLDSHFFFVKKKSRDTRQYRTITKVQPQNHG